MIAFIKKNRTLSNYPKGYWSLFSCEVISRYAFWAIQSLLVLHLINKLNFSKVNAYEFIGVYIALTYAMTFIGGLIGDKLLGYRNALLLGLISLIIGCCLVLFSNTIYILGFSFLIFGIGIIIPNITRYIGALYDAESQLDRNRGFSIFYLASNLGGICGPLIAGFINYYYGWQYAIISIVIFYSLWVIYFLFFKSKKQIRPERTINTYKTIIVLLFLLSFLFLLMKYQFLVDKFLIIALIAAFGYIYISCRKENMAKDLLHIFMCLIVALLFFTFEFQILSSLLIYSKEFVNTRIFGANVPVTSLVSIEPLFVVVFIPVFNWIWRKNKYRQQPLMKLVASMLLLGISYLVFLMSSITYYYTQYAISLLWIFMGILFMAAGEVCLMPPLLTFLSEKAPTKLKGTFFGILYITISLSGYLSSELATLTNKLSISDHQSLSYIEIYFIIMVICFVTAILIFPLCYRKKEIT